LLAPMEVGRQSGSPVRKRRCDRCCGEQRRNCAAPTVSAGCQPTSFRNCGTTRSPRCRVATTKAARRNQNNLERDKAAVFTDWSSENRVESFCERVIG
jgi:hypothetical protein